MNPCPSTDQLQLLLTDRLSGPEAEAVESHVEGCSLCQQALESLTRAATIGIGPDGPPPNSDFLRRLEQSPPDVAPPTDDPRKTFPALGSDATTPLASGDEPGDQTAVPPSGLASAARFELLEEIARGGMGAVLRGRDPALGRDLAVKVLLAGHQDHPEVRRRFLVEARVSGQLQHPGVVPV